VTLLGSGMDLFSGIVLWDPCGHCHWDRAGRGAFRSSRSRLSERPCLNVSARLCVKTGPVETPQRVQNQSNANPACYNYTRALCVCVCVPFRQRWIPCSFCNEHMGMASLHSVEYESSCSSAASLSLSSLRCTSGWKLWSRRLGLCRPGLLSRLVKRIIHLAHALHA
jgi:hypothetical protein